MTSAPPPPTDGGGRKRPRVASSSAAATTMNDGGASSSTTLLRGGHQLDILRSELDALRAELEHERSLRSLERKSAERSEARLKRQLALQLDESEEARALLEEVRASADENVRSIGAARRDALERLRETEGLLADAVDRIEDLTGGDDEDNGAVECERRKNALLQTHLDAREEEAQALRARLDEAERRAAEAERRAAEAAENEQSSAAKMVNLDAKGISVSAAENAMTLALRKELKGVNIKLADAERSNRQLSRAVEELQRSSKKVVQYRELASSAELKTKKVEAELSSLRADWEENRAVGKAWAEFRKEVERSFASEDDDDSASAYEDVSSTKNHPPEISTVLRRFQSLREKCRKLDEDRTEAWSQVETRRRRIEQLETRMKDDNAANEAWRGEKRDLAARMKTLELENALLKAQEGIWQREADGMRSLLGTYEEVEGRVAAGKGEMQNALASGGNGKADEMGSSPTAQGLQLSLSSAREQVQVLTEKTEALMDELKSSQTEVQELKSEHTRVLEKYGKLREALMQEREKASKAENRANEAETLAGKGSYNMDTTRVLHLKLNPMITAVREKYQMEIDSLRAALESKETELAAALDGSGASSKTPMASKTTPGSAGKGSLSSLDAQKLHKRLKESFKEQIGLFREGVYLLTGFKIDMFADSDRPRFKVRSMYAEREEDHLMFIWPKTKKQGGDGTATTEATSLDLLDTEMAQMLSKTDSFAYMTKFKSLPSFMASVTLSLFEKQTFIG